MSVSASLDQFEPFAERLSKAFGVIAHDWQPTAPHRTIRREGGDIRMASFAQCFLQSRDVGGAVGLVGENERRGDWHRYQPYYSVAFSHQVATVTSTCAPLSRIWPPMRSFRLAPSSQDL